MARLRLFLAVISMAWMAAVAACGGSDAAEVAFARVGGLNSAAWPPGTYQARTADAWQAIWAQREASGFPVSPIPLVDFGRDMVIGVSEGFGPNGCHSLGIVRVKEGNTELVVEYVRSMPRPDSQVMCTLAVVPLVEFVVTQQSRKPLRFSRTQS